MKIYLREVKECNVCAFQKLDVNYMLNVMLYKQTYYFLHKNINQLFSVLIILRNVS